MNKYRNAIQDQDNFDALLINRNGPEAATSIMMRLIFGASTATDKDELLVVRRMIQRKRNR